jgi:uncharacterized protein
MTCVYRFPDQPLYRGADLAKGELWYLNVPGRQFSVRVTPKAARNQIRVEAGPEPLIRVYVTCVPEDGKATRAVVKLLAKAIGVAKSDLELVRGATARQKMFRIRG